MSNRMPQERNDSRSSEVERVFDSAVKENVRIAQEIALIQSYRSNVLEKEVLKADNAISSLKQKHMKNQGELNSLKSKSLYIQEQFEKFAKSNKELSTKVTDLTTRIKQEKREELERLEALTEQLSRLQDVVKKTITISFHTQTPGDLEKLVASLKAQQKDIDINSQTLDQEVEFYEKELKEQREHAMCSEDSVNEFELPMEQQTVTLRIFEEGAESFQKVLEILMQEKERLKEQIGRLSKDF